MCLKLRERNRKLVSILLFGTMCITIHSPVFAQQKTETWDFTVSTASREVTTNEFACTYKGFIELSITTQHVGYVVSKCTSFNVEKDTPKSGLLSLPDKAIKFNVSNDVWRIENSEKYEFHHKRRLAGLTSFMLATISLHDQPSEHQEGAAWWWGVSPFIRKDTLLTQSLIWKSRKDGEDGYLFDNDEEFFYTSRLGSGCNLRFIAVLANDKLAREILTNKVLTAKNIFANPSLSKTKQFGFVEAKLTKRTR